MYKPTQPPVVTQETPDADWVVLHAIAQGDKRALHELYNRYGSLLLTYLNIKVNDIHTAEELLQDVLMAVWNHAHTFESRSRVKTWLLVIARNTANNSFRKKHVPIIQFNDMFAVPSGDTSPTEAVERAHRQDRVRSAIQQLPEAQREVLTLIFYHQLSGQEVAEILEISLGTVKSRLFRAKEMLKNLLVGEDL